MGLEDIGLSAVFKDAGFLSGISGYLSKVKEGESGTTSAAGKITKGLSAIGGPLVLGALAGVTAGIGTVVGAIMTGIPLASDLNETISKVGVVFGDSAQKVLDFGENAATALGTSKGDALAAAGTFGNLFRALGLTGDKSSDMSINMVQLASDLASFNNIDPTTALEKLRAGITGETEPLKSLGVNLNAAMIEAKALELGLADATGELTPAAKAQASYALILEQTTLAQGDFARTSDGLANQQRIAAAQFKDLRTKIGQVGLALAGKVFSKFNETLGKIIAKVTEWIGQMDDVSTPIGSITKSVTDFANSVLDSLPSIIAKFQQMGDFFKNNKPLIVGALAAITTAMAFWAWTTITAAIPAVVAFITAMAPAIAVMLLVGAVVAALGYAWENNFLGMRDTLTAFWETTVKPALQDLWAWLSVNVPAAIQTLSNFWTTVLLPAILSVWTWIQANLLPLLANLWSWLAVNVPLAIQTLSNFWTTVLLPAILAVWTWITTYLIPLFVAVATLVGTVVSLAVTVLAGLWQNVLVPAMKAVWDFISSNLLPIFMEIGQFIDENFRPILEWLAEFVGKTLVDAWRSLNDIITTLIGYIDQMIAKLKSISLPSWLTPGSPTPFEMGLRGIGDAMQQLSNAAIPAFRTELNAAVSSSPMASMRSGSSNPTPSAASSSINNTFNFGGNNINNNMDAAQFTALIRNVVREEMRG